MTAPVALDLLLRGATALTADPARPVIEDVVLGVAGDRIAVLAAADEVSPALTARREMALPGRLLTPGFVNVHTHALLCLLRGVSEDMGFAPAYTLGVPHGHDIAPDEAVALARLGAMEAMLFGSTLINDSYVHADLTLPAMLELGIRVHACPRVHDVDFTTVHQGRWDHHPTIGERSLGAALDLAARWHGGADGRAGVQIVPHAADTCSRDLLRAVREARDATGLRVSTHLAQTPIEVERVRAREGMSPVALLDDLGLLDDQLLAAHCIFVDDDDVRRIGRARAHVAHPPKVNSIGGYRAPTSRLRRAGARLALATDAMFMDMIESMRWALATGRTQEGRVDDFWQPGQVFEMATRAGAAAMGLEAEIGTLTAGRKADLVVIDVRRPHQRPVRDPLGTLVHACQGRDVEHVLVDGRLVVEDGMPVHVDPERVAAEAERAARALWRRAGSLAVPDGKGGRHGD